MVNLLLRGPLCVKHLQAILNLPQVTVSKQLGYLKKRGLVTVRRHRNLRVHLLPASPPPTLEAHLKCLRECAATDELCQGDLRRREAIQETVHRDLSGEAAAPQSTRQPAREPEPGSAATWPSVEDGPFLD